MMTDQARKLFAILVNEAWEKHLELVVPGWEYGHYCGYDGFSDEGWHKPDQHGNAICLVSDAPPVLYHTLF